jgi:radical SAM protein with 4Fe4S-binding SPASM domain
MPNGQIVGCSALAMLNKKFPELILGDVYNGLDQNSIDHLVQLVQTDGGDRPICKNCKSSINCTGGCLAINYSTSGIAFSPPELYCKTISAIPEALKKAWK